jgi:hypothetical protein
MIGQVGIVVMHGMRMVELMTRAIRMSNAMPVVETQSMSGVTVSHAMTGSDVSASDKDNTYNT